MRTINVPKSKTILLVDDDPFLQSLYRKALEVEGFKILTANDGAAVAKMLPDIAADLIVLDLLLPKLDGLKVLDAIRASSSHINLPVLILTNAYLPELAEKAMKAGAISGLLKSECSPKKLAKIIRDAFKTAPCEGGKQPAARNSWLSTLGWNKAKDPGQRDESAGAVETDTVETAASSEIKNELLKTWKTDISMIRTSCLRYVKSVGRHESDDNLKELYHGVRILNARATMGGCCKISQLSCAFEALLFERGFHFNGNMSPSVLQTMVQAVDSLEYLFKTGCTDSIQGAQKARVLLVDDNQVCNMGNDIALKRANFDTTRANDGVAALELVETSSFDLILLDIDMPVLNGFEVCEKIRKRPLCKETPLIFLTIHDDFQSRTDSALCGGDGFIAKPISSTELIVKALIFLFRAQGRKVSKNQPADVKPIVDKNTAGPQPQESPANQPKIEKLGKELEATQAAVEYRVTALTQELAAEMKHRQEAEQQVVEHAKLQSRLENTQTENQKAHECFQRMLEKSQNDQASGADGRSRALESLRNFMENKVATLTGVLAEHAKRSASAKQRAADYVRRTSEIEVALAEIQQAREHLLRKIKTAGNDKVRGELE